MHDAKVIQIEPQWQSLDQIGEFAVIEVPVLWITALPKIRSIPLYGVGTSQSWLEIPKAPRQVAHAS
jgi:hypothetical protein